MRSAFIVIMFLCASDAGYAGGGFTGRESDAGPPQRSIHTDACQRSCDNGSPGYMVKAMLVDPILRRRSMETVNIYRAEPPPPVACHCKSVPLQDRNDDDRHTTGTLVTRCARQCQSGVHSYRAIVVERNGREHEERVCILDFARAIACLCTEIPLARRPRSRLHDPI